MIAALYVLNMVLYDCIVQVGGESYRRAFALPVETKEKWDGVEPLAKFLWRNGGYAWNQRHWEHVWCATEDLSEMY